MEDDPIGDAMVLVVDEEPAGLLTLQEMLQDSGYLMMTALTGSAAKRILEQRPGEIQAIVLELALPDMDGSSSPGPPWAWSTWGAGTRSG